MENYIIRNGYEDLGTAASLEEAMEICEEYCNQNVSYELKRVLEADNVTVLIYQYWTLYLETFVISKDVEIEAIA
ncbi:MAG: hypothetical protein LBS36_06650 [Oscillospiraceae bacterium]|jgi:hypothetical protein|nr:hypothetical protein [Oscillospiraceae bacterium]